VKVVVRGREAPEIKAGDVGYVKAFFPKDYINAWPDGGGSHSYVVRP